MILKWLWEVKIWKCCQLVYFKIWKSSENTVHLSDYIVKQDTVKNVSCVQQMYEIKIWLRILGYRYDPWPFYLLVGPCDVEQKLCRNINPYNNIILKLDVVYWSFYMNIFLAYFLRPVMAFGHSKLIGMSLEKLLWPKYSSVSYLLSNTSFFIIYFHIMIMKLCHKLECMNIVRLFLLNFSFVELLVETCIICLVTRKYFYCSLE